MNSVREGNIYLKLLTSLHMVSPYSEIDAATRETAVLAPRRYVVARNRTLLMVIPGIVGQKA